MLAHRTYTTESVKRLFAALEKGKAAGVKPLGVLADYVEVDPQFEKPAEEFLHEELEYVVVENWQRGRARSRFHPRRTGRPRHFPGASRIRTATKNRRCPSRPSARKPASPARLSDSLRLTNGFRDRATDLLPRVSLCFLAEDRAAAQRLSISYPHLYFLLPDGVCYHGHTVTGGKKTGAGPLAMKREARELAKLLAERQGVLDERTNAPRIAGA